MKNYFAIFSLCFLAGCGSFGGRSEHCSGIRTTLNGYVVQDREDCTWGDESVKTFGFELNSQSPGYGYSSYSYPAATRHGYQQSPTCPTIYRNGRRQCM